MPEELILTYRLEERIPLEAGAPSAHIERWTVSVFLDYAANGDDRVEIGYAHVLVFTLESGTDIGKLADPASGTWIDVDTRPNTPGLPADLGDGSERTGHILLLDRVWLDPDHRGRDGSTSRILEAVQRPGGPWERRGVSIDVGLAGESDAYGVESPSVVFTPGGYLMAYAGSDGADTRLHMAASSDGRLWKPLGTFMQREEADAVGATHPCLVVTSQRWWLFYSGYDGSENGRRAAILAAVSDSGASWQPLRMGSPGTGGASLCLEAATTSTPWRSGVPACSE